MRVVQKVTVERMEELSGASPTALIGVLSCSTYRIEVAIARSRCSKFGGRTTPSSAFGDMGSNPLVRFTTENGARCGEGRDFPCRQTSLLKYNVLWLAPSNLGKPHQIYIHIA